MRSVSLLAPTGAWSTLAPLRLWPARRWFAATLFIAAAAMVLGIPTGIVPSSLYHRMTPVTWWDYPVWAASAVLAGLTAATYVCAPAAASHATDPGRRSTLATLGSLVAIGCPVCNKVVVAALGVSGAMTYWAPLQPALGVLSVALLAAGFWLRLRGERQCERSVT